MCYKNTTVDPEGLKKTAEEILEGKIVTTAFDYKPYHTGENMHFCSYSLNKDARARIKYIDGYNRSDVYINNIEKITYKGKTLYQKEDKKCS